MERPKNLEDFVASLKLSGPPDFWPDALRALWYDGKGDWEGAHDIAQNMMGKDGSWIHGYLHRKEGDRFNAEYWYGRADEPYPKIGLEEEFQELVRHFLEE